MMHGRAAGMIDCVREWNDGELGPAEHAELWRLAVRLQASDSVGDAEAVAAAAVARSGSRSPALARAIRETVEPALANLRDRERLEHLAIRDPLTGLFNRRHLDDALTRLVSHAVGHDEPLAVALIDLDRFRDCNDRHGHRAGDLVLQWVAILLQVHALRHPGDIPCRYGGEEFVLIMPDATVAQAVSRLEPLRRRLGECGIDHDGRQLAAVTASIGIAACPRDGTTPAVLVEAADAAMYRAKRAGGDRICVAGDGENREEAQPRQAGQD